MSLTYGQAKKTLAPYAGKGGKTASSDEVDTFVLKVLQYALITGSPNRERIFTFNATNGHFTAPYELEVPLKVRIDGRIGNVGSRWFDFRSGNESLGKCYGADSMIEDPNSYVTAYDLPAGGSQIGVAGTVDEDCDSYMIISGLDATGREIFTQHKGADIAGERLNIVNRQITWSNVSFATITSVVKTKTRGYTPVYYKQGIGKGFLSDYSPVEEVPSYRRFRLDIPKCPELAKISVLGRIRLKNVYADNDRIPFDNLYALEIAGQQANNQINKDFQAAAEGDKFLQELGQRDAEYKRPTNGQPVEFYFPLSGGTIKGIIG